MADLQTGSRAALRQRVQSCGWAPLAALPPRWALPFGHQLGKIPLCCTAGMRKSISEAHVPRTCYCPAEKRGITYASCLLRIAVPEAVDPTGTAAHAPLQRRRCCGMAGSDGRLGRRPAGSSDRVARAGIAAGTRCAHTAAVSVRGRPAVHTSAVAEALPAVHLPLACLALRPDRGGCAMQGQRAAGAIWRRRRGSDLNPRRLPSGWRARCPARPSSTSGIRKRDRDTCPAGASVHGGGIRFPIAPSVLFTSIFRRPYFRSDTNQRLPAPATPLDHRTGTRAPAATLVRAPQVRPPPVAGLPGPCGAPCRSREGCRGTGHGGPRALP